MNDSKNSSHLARHKKAHVLSLKTDTVPPYTTTNTVFYGEHSFYVIDPAPTDVQEQKILSQHITERLQQGHTFLGSILTHHHGDHIGAAAWIKSQFNMPIFAHHELKKHVNFAVDITIDEGDELYFDDHHTLKIFYTPGHADSHIVVYDPEEQCIIAGDMITDRGTILIPPLSGSLKVYLYELERLTNLAIKMVIPAHGNAITDNARMFLLNALKHRLTRIKQIYEVLSRAQLLIDATDITTILYQAEVPAHVLFFAQLSVESGLYWLKENELALFENYRWRLSEHSLKDVEEKILWPLEQIEQRLRNA